MKYLPPARLKLVPKVYVQNLLKFSTFDNANIPILVLMSKIVFMKYLPLAWLKTYPKKEMLRI